jgi:hypothetical protein
MLHTALIHLVSAMHSHMCCQHSHIFQHMRCIAALPLGPDAYNRKRCTDMLTRDQTQSAGQCRTMQCGVVLYCVMACHAVPYKAMQSCAMPCSATAGCAGRPCSLEGLQKPCHGFHVVHPATKGPWLLPQQRIHRAAIQQAAAVTNL